MEVTELVQQVYDRAVELEKNSDKPYKLYFLCNEEWERWENYCRFQRESCKMEIAITAKSLDAAVCLILLTEKYVNKQNMTDTWEYYFREFKEGDKFEDYIKSKYSEIREESTDLPIYTNTIDEFEKTTIYKKRKESIEIYDIDRVGQLYS